MFLKQSTQWSAIRYIAGALVLIMLISILLIPSKAQQTEIPAEAEALPVQTAAETTAPAPTEFVQTKATEPIAEDPANIAESVTTATEPVVVHTEPAAVTTVPETTEAAASPYLDPDLFARIEAELNGIVPEQEAEIGSIPLYSQDDYADVAYAGGTIATNGSSITALAMVATSMTGHYYYPDDLAHWFDDGSESTIDKLEKAAQTLQLSWSRAKNYDYVLSALEQGKLVIELVMAPSIFTTGQHYVLLSGMNEDGKITVIEPSAAVRERSELANGFAGGFTKNELLVGYGGAWIFDPAAMPETPFIYQPVKEERRTNSRYFPSYAQEDYPNELYGSGTVATSGCSITALAMVATYMTGHQYYPDELARYFGASASNNVARLEFACDALKLKWKKAQNYDYVLQALRDGKVVIQMVNSESRFTGTQHFLVLTGFSKDGKIYVLDPSSANWNRDDLQDGYTNGFSQNSILKGYDGAWIFDPKAMPEDPYIYTEPEREYVEPRYPGLDLTPEDINLLARLVWVESRGESKDGQQAVAEVVLNRLVSPDFSHDMRTIVYGQGQFVTKHLDEATPEQAQYEAIERALYGPYVLPLDVYYYARQALTDNIWGRIGGHVFCRMGNHL